MADRNDERKEEITTTKDEIYSRLSRQLLDLGEQARYWPSALRKIPRLFLFIVSVFEVTRAECRGSLREFKGVEDEMIGEALALLYVANMRLEVCFRHIMSEGLFRGEMYDYTPGSWEEIDKATRAPYQLDEAPEFNKALLALDEFKTEFGREFELMGARLAFRIGKFPSNLGADLSTQPQGSWMPVQVAVDIVLAIAYNPNQDDSRLRDTVRKELARAVNSGRIARHPDSSPVRYLVTSVINYANEKAVELRRIDRR